MYKRFLFALSLLIFSIISHCHTVTTARKILNSDKFFKYCQVPNKHYSDRELDWLAQRCCENKNKTLVTIIWPRGQDYLDSIKSMMEPHCTLIYEKHFQLINDGVKHLDQFAHQSKKRKEIKEHATLYVPVEIPSPYKCTAILFKTDMKLKDIKAMKQKIRDMVGATYFSIHIDDYNDKSQYLASKVFDDSILDSICSKAF